MNETSIQINETFYRWFNFALARIENVHLEICTYLFETKLNGIFFHIIFLTYCEKNCSSEWEKLLKFEAEGW